MAKRVFCSFDYDNDRGLKDLLVGQSRNSDSPFEVIDHSLKESQPESDWVKKAEAAINRAEVVIVVLGSRTHSAPGVKKEIAIAKRLGKTRFQIKPADKNPTAVADGGRVYNWTWTNLKNLLS